MKGTTGRHPQAARCSRTLKAGSSKQGKAVRAELASNWVVARLRCSPLASVYVLLHTGRAGHGGGGAHKHASGQGLQVQTLVLLARPV